MYSLQIIQKFRGMIATGMFCPTNDIFVMIDDAKAEKKRGTLSKISWNVSLLYVYAQVSQFKCHWHVFMSLSKHSKVQCGLRCTFQCLPGLW